MVSFARSAERTDSITGISASASCSLHSSTIKRSCWSAGDSRCSSGVKMVLASIRRARTKGNISHVCYLKLCQTALITCTLHRISQWIGEVIHRNSPQRYSTLHLFSVECDAIPLFGVTQYIIQHIWSQWNWIIVSARQPHLPKIKSFSRRRWCWLSVCRPRERAKGNMRHGRHQLPH